MYDSQHGGAPDQRAFFSDTTADYVSPVQPDLFDTVTIRLRVGRGQVQSCFLVTDDAPFGWGSSRRNAGGGKPEARAALTGAAGGTAAAGRRAAGKRRGDRAGAGPEQGRAGAGSGRRAGRKGGWSGRETGMKDHSSLLMHLAGSDACFDYYEVRFEITRSPLRYYFVIYAGGHRFRYTRRGIRNTIRPADYWHIIPGFHTPSWAEGAVMYQIFVDRFCNGDPSNDVRTGEYSYMGQPSIQVADWDRPPTSAGYREFYGGDLQGVIDKLDYLQRLGVEAISLNPIFLSPSSHKYDTQDYAHIDPHFGKILHDRGDFLLPEDGSRGRTCRTGAGNDTAAGRKDSRRLQKEYRSRENEYDERQESGSAGTAGPDLSGWKSIRSRHTNQRATRYLDRVTNPANLEASDRLFAKLVREAHARGIRVILDGVFNHCGSFHRWLDAEKIYERLPGGNKGAHASKRSPYVDFFRFEKDDWPSNDSYDAWWDFGTLPKLYYENSEVLCQYILKIGRKWVSPPYCADGWRLDVAADLGYSREFNHAFWQRFRAAVKEANPEAIILAENYADSQDWLQGDEWDTIMNYEFFMEPVTYFLTGMEKHSDARNEERYGDPDAFWQAVSCRYRDAMPDAALRISMNELSNHDHSRFLTRTNRAVGRVEFLGTDAATEGVHMEVMRQAVLLQMTWTGAPTIYYGDEAGLGGFTDPDNRRTYPWGREDRALVEYHRILANLRRISPALRRGSLLRLPDADGLLAYARFVRGAGGLTGAHNAAESWIVLININYIPIDYAARVIYAGIPEEAELTCILLTGRDGYAAGASGEIVPVDVHDGWIGLTLPPESGLLLRWSPEDLPEDLFNPETGGRAESDKAAGPEETAESEETAGSEGTAGPEETAGSKGTAGSGERAGSEEGGVSRDRAASENRSDSEKREKSGEGSDSGERDGFGESAASGEREKSGEGEDPEEKAGAEQGAEPGGSADAKMPAAPNDPGDPQAAGQDACPPGP